MKKLLFSIILTGALFVSCGDNGKAAKTTKAANIKVVKNTKTTTFNKMDTSSQIAWRATHLGGTSPRFGFIKPSSIEFLVNEGVLTNAKVKIAMNSLTVTSFPAGDDQIADLTKHLKSADFFNTTKYPNATFELVNTTPVTGDFNVVVTGNLTILDKTKSIKFKANIQVNDDNVTLKSEKFTVNRKDWGLTYHTEGTVGVPKDYLIADAIGFEIDVKAIK
jgi:polyisoprenoid-binding protein YceI